MTSGACNLARDQEESINYRYGDLENYLREQSASNRLTEHHRIITSAGVAITTSIRGCVCLLESKKWLNVYEMVREEHPGADSTELESLVNARLGKWAAGRRLVDAMLQFGPDTHYAALNLGGVGPTRYGNCGIRLRCDVISGIATSFIGDTIHEICSAAGEQLLSNEEALARFGLWEHLPMLAGIHRREMLGQSTHIISRDVIRQQTEHADCVHEVQIHGPISLDCVEAVAISEADYHQLWDRMSDFERVREGVRGLRKYDEVRSFKRLMELRKECPAIPFELVR
jgi:hypothetical protein